MRAGDAAATIIRPAISGTLRARQTKKTRHAVTAKQLLGYIVVAALTTWLTKALDDLVERQFSATDA